MVQSSTAQRTLKMVQLAILLALVIVLQFASTMLIKFGVTSISLVLIPIVIAGILYGPKSGALLGLFFGIEVLVFGFIGLDGFTNTLLTYYPPYSTLLIIVVCLLKGTLAGFLSAWIYRALHKKFPLTSVFLTAATAPLVNTGIFILGMLPFLNTGAMEKIGYVPNSGMTAFSYVIISIVSINFVFEFVLNVALSPAVYRIISAVKK